MQSLRLNFGKLVSVISRPKILVTKHDISSCVDEELIFIFDQPSIHEKLDGMSFEINCRVGTDAITSRPIKSLIIELAKLDFISPLIVEIQQNLDNLEAIRVFGMNYKNRIWREIKLIDDEPINFKREKKITSFTKSYIEAEHIQISSSKFKPKTPSFWDLVYALLQPPLILEQIENLYLPHDLYPFQKTGIQFLMDNESALLADEMGTGKTVQTIVAIRLLMQKGHAHSSLIVCCGPTVYRRDE